MISSYREFKELIRNSSGEYDLFLLEAHSKFPDVPDKVLLKYWIFYWGHHN